MSYYRHAFAHLLHQLYEEMDRRDIRDRELLMLGAQILVHVFRVSCARGHDLKAAAYQCKEANVYFFEYMQQMEDSGLSLEHGKMASFIYDKVLKPRPALQANAEANAEADQGGLNALPDILSLLPDVSHHVTMQQLKDLWRGNSAICAAAESASI